MGFIHRYHDNPYNIIIEWMQGDTYRLHPPEREDSIVLTEKQMIGIALYMYPKARDIMESDND
jgi:hypothetical protein